MKSERTLNQNETPIFFSCLLVLLRLCVPVILPRNRGGGNAGRRAVGKSGHHVLDRQRFCERPWGVGLTSTWAQCLGLGRYGSMVLVPASSDRGHDLTDRAVVIESLSNPSRT